MNYAGLKRLRITLADDASHVAFMIFVWAEDVKIFQACDAVEPALLPSVQVHPLFREAVKIQGSQAPELARVGIVHARAAISVGCRRRGINETDTFAQGPFRKLARIFVIVLAQVLLVGFCRRGTSAEMKNEIDSSQRARRQAREQFSGV